MTVKDSIGGWKDNAFVFKAPKGCTVLKNFLGKSWTPLLTGLGVPNATCPVRSVRINDVRLSTISII